MTTVSDKATGAVTVPVPSATVTEKFDVPTAVGVPLITPVDGASANPAGSEPVVTCQFAYGGNPPVGDNVAEYALPTVALASVVVATLGVVEVAASTWLGVSATPFQVRRR